MAAEAKRRRLDVKRVIILRLIQGLGVCRGFVVDGDDNESSKHRRRLGSLYTLS